MTSHASFEAAPHPRKMPLLTAGFRPLFLAAGIWSVVALAVWIALLSGVFALPSQFDPLSWHIHEMMYGFVMAAIGGFLLTAIANWTARPPVADGVLAMLSLLWIAGRAVCLVSAWFAAWVGVAVDLAFPTALMLVALRELIAANNRRNYTLLAPLVLLVVADLLMHLTALGVSIPIGLGWRLAMFCIVVLLSVIAGRIIPAFTRNWLAAHGNARQPAAMGRLDRIALGLLHASLLCWVLVTDSALVGAALVAAGALHLWRLVRWQGHATVREPLLLILHVGYLWLAAGTALLGLSTLSDVVPAAAGIHALTTGAFGTMILAVMTRASLGHTGRALHADGATVAIYILVTLAAVLRVVAAWPGVWTMALLEPAAAAWVAAFALFVAHYGPMLVRPPIDA
jgi:uncharacterized protein involved in response to NO